MIFNLRSKSHQFCSPVSVDHLDGPVSRRIDLLSSVSREACLPNLIYPLILFPPRQ